jgi:hypothetical protein
MKQTGSKTKKAAIKKKSAPTRAPKRRVYRDPTPLQLEKAARAGIKKAEAETMAVTGYNVIAKDGWVVKVFADGSKDEKISRLPRIKKLTGKQLAKFNVG